MTVEEALLLRFVAYQRMREELADVQADPDALEEAVELEMAGWSALGMVRSGTWSVEER